jgi:mycothiol synthase
VIELSWHRGLDESAEREVRALAEAAAAADGVAPLGEHVLLHLRDDATSHLLARDGSNLVGFAHLADGPAEHTAELVVHPEHRRRGLGTRLVQGLLEAAEGERLQAWAHGRHTGAVALAERLGFSAMRELWQMQRSLLEPLPEAVLPEGVRLRPFVVGADEPEFLRVNNAAFAWHPEQGGWDAPQVRVREAEPWFDAAGFLLAVDAHDRLLGFHWTKVHADAGDGSGPIGEVYVLGVDPAEQGIRLGAGLTLAGLRHLRDKGLTRVMLYVEADNAPAVRLYQNLGFTLWRSDVLYAREVGIT